MKIQIQSGYKRFRIRKSKIENSICITQKIKNRKKIESFFNNFNHLFWYSIILYNSLIFWSFKEVYVLGSLSFVHVLDDELP